MLAARGTNFSGAFTVRTVSNTHSPKLYVAIALSHIADLLLNPR